MTFRLMLLSLLVAGLALTGCVAPRTQRPVERPLEEIPTYDATAVTYRTDARISVYASLRFANQLAQALKKAGYEIAQDADFAAQTPRRPDFIVDQLTFNNWTHLHKGELWLYTRITVSVRKPLLDGADVGWRVFQAYARTNLGHRTQALMLDYVRNEGRAVDNLMCVPEFRKALEK